MPKHNPTCECPPCEVSAGDCPECCRCVPNRICIRLQIDDTDCECPGGCRSVAWSEASQSYWIPVDDANPEGLACGIDVRITLERDEYGQCYVVLASEVLQYINLQPYGADERLRQMLQPDGEGCPKPTCRAMQFEFEVDLQRAGFCCTSASILLSLGEDQPHQFEICGEEMQQPCCPKPPNTGQYFYYDEYAACLRDAVWEMDGPEGTGIAPFIPNPLDWNQYWVGGTGDSSWLSSNCLPNEGTDEEDAIRTYRVDWEVLEDPCRWKLFVRFAVDNQLLSTKLNGNDIGISLKPPAIPDPCETSSFDGVVAFGRWHVFEIPTNALNVGINTLEFETLNKQGSCVSPGPDGFRAEFSCCLCSDETMPFCSGLVNTGQRRGNLAGYCYTDGAWTGDANNIPNTEILSSWIPNSAASSWLTPSCDALALHPEEDYEYSLDFYILNRPEDLKIFGRFAVDNQLLSVEFNSVDQGISLTPTPCFDPDAGAAFGSWHEFEICDGLVLGLNTIKFTTRNEKGTCNAPFQAGFRCELSCVLKECLWVAQSDGNGGSAWTLQSGPCPEGSVCLEPTETPTEECEHTRTCCVEIYDNGE